MPLKPMSKAARLDPQNHRIQGNLGEVYYWTPGKRATAMSAYRQAVALATEELSVNPRDAALLGDLARYHAILGDRAAALKHLKRGLEVSPADPELLFQAALVHHQFGETAQALDWLRKALKAGYSVASIRDDPFFEDLHQHPEFQKLIQSNSAE